MNIYKKLFIMLIFLGSYGIALHMPLIEKACYGQNTGGTIQSTKKTDTKSASTRKNKNPVDPYAKEIKKSGDIVVVSRSFTELVRKNNSIIFSKVAVQQRLDDTGKIAGYELVSIDRGSAAEKTGLRSHDLITGVNGVPARDFNANRESLEACNRFDITLLRKGKEKNIIIEIQPSQ
ncbi:MAG: hypothetical protein C0392_07755 [Syntrophus sp. (in: bacteria)]|nr:hypothetical protein [Syntrophus sp. (in: bacteria)]